MTLSTEQIHQWETEGYLLLKQAVPLPIIEDVRQLFAQMVDRIIGQLRTEDLIQDKN